ncbi:hypothetical protein Q5P01_000249 [Channa striata]|uniref:Uncharacterized protein n=1 Tax=Channa striata TaxID=64152 RepID=A0AA88LFA1_CHASR|nr:hypothetical protein Q5P01_000249 [Channa striata]
MPGKEKRSGGAMSNQPDSQRLPGGVVRTVQILELRGLADPLKSAREGGDGGVTGSTTKASAVEKLKKGLDAVKKVARRARPKGLRRYRGGGDEQQRHHHQIGQVRRRARQQNRDRGSDPQSGKQLLAKGVSGGLIALAELTGHPLSEEEEQTIEREWRQATGGRLLQYTRSSQEEATASWRSRPVSRQQDSFWGAHGVACEQKGPQAVRDVEIAENTLGLVRRFYRRQFGPITTEYKMLKPKVLFHTWVAISGSGIFGGAFALPKAGRKLDYVSKIKSNARFLEKQRIPLMIVYSSLNLPLEEEA